MQMIQYQDVKHFRQQVHLKYHYHLQKCIIHQACALSHLPGHQLTRFQLSREVPVNQYGGHGAYSRLLASPLTLTFSDAAIQEINSSPATYIKIKLFCLRLRQ
jgi:hypothetical protein